MKIGRPEAEGTQLGPLISHEHRNKVAVVLQEGGRRGRQRSSPAAGFPTCGKELEKGAWIEPTIWTGLPETATVVQEEIFGPCCHVQPFDTRGRGRCAWRTTRHTASRRRSGPPNLARAHRVAAQDRRRHLLDQQLVPARPAHGVRRLQGLGHRPRGRRALARVLHRAAQRLREARRGRTTRRWSAAKRMPQVGLGP